MSINALVGSLGGRKFIVAVVSLLTVVLGSKFGIDVDTHKDTIIWIVSSYLVGQGVADAATAGKTSSFVAATKKDA